jgi:hypothetical protein
MQNNNIVTLLRCIMPTSAYNDKPEEFKNFLTVFYETTKNILAISKLQ